MLINTIHPAEEDGGGKAPEKDENKEAPQGSYQKLKESHTKLEEKLQAQENSHQAANRKQEDRIKALEVAGETPPEDSDRIANLEVELARSKAVSRFGLSPEDAELLKGSPEEIAESAEYWATRIKDNKPKEDPKKEDDKTNREIIDEKLKGKDNIKDENGNLTPPNKPDPKKGNLSWLDTYKQATVAERYKMDQQVQRGDVDPTK